MDHGQSERPADVHRSDNAALRQTAVAPIDRCRLILSFLVPPAAVRLRPAVAQSWPGRTIRIVVPFPAGGSADLSARLLAEQLKAKLGNPWSWKTKLAPVATWPPLRPHAPTLMDTRSSLAPTAPRPSTRASTARSLTTRRPTDRITSERACSREPSAASRISSLCAGPPSYRAPSDLPFIS